MGGGSVSTASGTGGHNEGGCSANLTSDPDHCGTCDHACSDLGVAVRQCVGGRCRPVCEDGFVDITTPATEDDGCERAGRRVFVTSQSYPVVDIGGVSGADAHCNQLAMAQDLGGEWRAWLSADDASSPAERFETEPPAPYRLLDGTVVAANWGALVGPSFGLEHAIDLTETESKVSGNASLVWTGTTPQGRSVEEGNCNGWGNNVSSAAAVGDCTQVTTAWTQRGQLVPCSQTAARLYCFEQ